MKSLSIVIPVYNGQNYIENCIESIARQNNEKIEIVLVNDGSTDNTGALCKVLSEKYSFVKYFEKSNGGVSSARNFALEDVTNEYVWFVDADDTIVDNALSEIFNIETDLGVFDFIKLTDEREEKISLIEKDFLYRLNSFDKFFEDYVFGYKLNNALWNKIFKTSIIKENNLKFDENIKIGEDFLFGLNYYKFVKEIYFCKATIYKYYINESGAMKNKNHKRFAYQQAIAESVKKEYQNILSPLVMEQFLLMQLVCGINQSKERGTNKKEIKKLTKKYMQEVMNGKRFTRKIVNNFLNSEGAGFLSKIKFRLLNWKVLR